MKKIVSVIKPFMLDQTILVYEDGNKIDAVTANIDDLPNIVLDLARQYTLNDIELAGPVSYLNGIKKEINELEMLTYGTNNINIKVISN